MKAVYHLNGTAIEPVVSVNGHSVPLSWCPARQCPLDTLPCPFQMKMPNYPPETTEWPMIERISETEVSYGSVNTQYQLS